jgi:hypothetical protein
VLLVRLFETIRACFANHTNPDGRPLPVVREHCSSPENLSIKSVQAAGLHFPLCLTQIFVELRSGRVCVIRNRIAAPARFKQPNQQHPSLLAHSTNNARPD